MKQQALELVEELNQNSWIESEENTHWWQPFEFVFNGYELIKFMGEIIWDSENNEIEYDYENDCPKYSLKEHILKEAKELLSVLNNRIEML